MKKKKLWVIAAPVGAVIAVTAASMSPALAAQTPIGVGAAAVTKGSIAVSSNPETGIVSVPRVECQQQLDQAQLLVNQKINAENRLLNASSQTLAIFNGIASFAALEPTGILSSLLGGTLAAAQETHLLGTQLGLTTLDLGNTNPAFNYGELEIFPGLTTPEIAVTVPIVDYKITLVSSVEIPRVTLGSWYGESGVIGLEKTVNDMQAASLAKPNCNADFIGTVRIYSPDDSLAPGLEVEGGLRVDGGATLRGGLTLGGGLKFTENISLSSDPNNPAVNNGGAGAFAAGTSTVTSGIGAVAIGNLNVAGGDGAIALGENNTATGVGAVSIGNFNSATGIGAVALGDHSIAAAQSAVAIGQGATTSADSLASIAVGQNANARGANSIVIGVDASSTAVATNAVVIGHGAVGSADPVTVLGAFASATADDATAIGEGSTASGVTSVALGSDAIAASTNSIAIGDNAEVAPVATGSVALGANTSVVGTNSVALGQGSSADRNNTVSVGNAATGLTRQITNVANGTAGTDAVNLNQLYSVRTDLNTKINQTGALAAAYSQIQLPRGYSHGLGVGLGTQGGAGAIAIGVSAEVGNNMLIKFTTGVSGNTTSAGAGLNFGW